jgi:hypothetical protein
MSRLNDLFSCVLLAKKVSKQLHSQSTMKGFAFCQDSVCYRYPHISWMRSNVLLWAPHTAGQLLAGGGPLCQSVVYVVHR